MKKKKGKTSQLLCNFIFKFQINLCPLIHLPNMLFHLIPTLYFLFLKCENKTSHPSFQGFFFLGRLKALFKSYSENDTLRLRAYSIKQWVFSIHAIKSTTLKHVLLADGLIYYLTYKYVKIQHSKKPHASVIPNTTTTIDQILCITWSMYMTIWKCRNKILSEK